MCNGYKKHFLSNYSIELPDPSLSLEADVLHPLDLAQEEKAVSYIHYSVLMSKSTKQAIYLAQIVDISSQVTISGSKGSISQNETQFSLRVN